MQPDILVARAMSGRNACWEAARRCWQQLPGVPGARAHQLDTAGCLCLTVQGPAWKMCGLQQHVARMRPEGCELHEELQRPGSREQLVKACFRCRVISAWRHAERVAPTTNMAMGGLQQCQLRQRFETCDVSLSRLDKARSHCPYVLHVPGFGKPNHLR